MWKIDVSEDTSFKYPEAPEWNKINYGLSKSILVALNSMIPSKERVPPVVDVPLIPQQIFLCNFKKRE